MSYIMNILYKRMNEKPERVPWNSGHPWHKAQQRGSWQPGENPPSMDSFSLLLKTLFYIYFQRVSEPSPHLYLLKTHTQMNKHRKYRNTHTPLHIYIYMKRVLGLYLNRKWHFAWAFDADSASGFLYLVLTFSSSWRRVHNSVWTTVDLFPFGYLWSGLGFSRFSY